MELTETTTKAQPAVTPDETLDPQTIKTMREIELDTLTSYTLADAIREGSEDLEQSQGWGNGRDSGCALTAAAKGAIDRGYI